MAVYRAGWLAKSSDDVRKFIFLVARDRLSPRSASAAAHCFHRIIRESDATLLLATGGVGARVGTVGCCGSWSVLHAALRGDSAHNGMRAPGGERARRLQRAGDAGALRAEPASPSRAHAQDGSPPAELTDRFRSAGSREEGSVALGRQTNLKLVYPSAPTTGKLQWQRRRTNDRQRRAANLPLRRGSVTLGNLTAAADPRPNGVDQGRAQASIPLDTINAEAGRRARPAGSSVWVWPRFRRSRTLTGQQAVAVSKTGTKLADIPGSIQNGAARTAV